jgi:hypothetical protein
MAGNKQRGRHRHPYFFMRSTEVLAFITVAAAARCNPKIAGNIPSLHRKLNAAGRVPP